MSLVVSKVLPLLLFPVGLTILLCLLSAGLAWRGFRRASAGAALAAAVVLYLAACPLVSNALLRGLESRYPPLENPPRATAIVLLGGGMVPPVAPRLHPETNNAGDRLLYAARLWRGGAAPRIVTTGGYIPFMNPAKSGDAQEYARALRELFDVPEEALHLVPESLTTVEDASMTAELFAREGWPRDILLVTSASHMSRAAALFRRQGFEVTPAPTDFVAEERSIQPFQFLPTVDALARTHMALHEYVGTWVYRVGGKL